MLLNVKTAYSLLNSTVNIRKYLQKAKQNGYNAIGIADENVMHGAVEFYQECLKYNIKPLIGLTIEMEGLVRQDKQFPFIVYAKSYEGYGLLMKVSRRLNQQPVPVKEIWQLLKEQENHLVLISAGRSGELEQALIHDDLVWANQILDYWRDALGEQNIYMGVPIYPYNPLEIDNILTFCRQANLPLVINQLVDTIQQEDAFSLKVLQAIGANEQLDISLRNIRGGHYIYHESELKNLYTEAGLEFVISETEQLIEQLNVNIPLEQQWLPKYLAPHNLSSDNYLKQLTLDSLKAHGYQNETVYLDRLKHELQVIQQMGFSDYFLIVWDILSYCHENKIRVGPGRGSAAGSLVSYLLQITLVDPIEYDLLFERFLNPERYNMPDIDIDIPDNKRDIVLQYIEKKYGHEQVAQICTFGTFGAKQSIRDTLRVLGSDSKELKHWSNAIPKELDITLESAYTKSATLRDIVESSEVNRQKFQVALTIEGLPRHVSTHAAAVVISDFPIEEQVPVLDRPQQMLITQFAMADVEHMGLLKMDFLGLRNLKLLDDILTNLAKSEKVILEINNINMNDDQTLEIFRKADTNGVFQFESDGIRHVLRKLQPASFEDIVAVNALFRPGPMKQIDSFIRRKHGEEKIEYLHPLLEDILANTYGIIVYQEQVMQICQKMAGFSLGQADILRRAMGKKQADIMEKEREHFIEGAKQNGIDSSTAEKVYQYIYEFANYGFNRAHAVVYSTLAYQLAYLKVHYPLEFYQALLNNGRSNTTTSNQYIQEAKKRLKKIKSVDINTSLSDFSIHNSQIQVGFEAVKGMRKDLIQHIIDDRNLLGNYTDLLNFLRRLPNNYLKSEFVQPLIDSGAFDGFGYNRATLTHNLPKMIQSVEFSGQNINLFAEIEPKVTWIEEWSTSELLEKEQNVLGFNLAGHPLDDYQGYIEHNTNLNTLSAVFEMKPKQRIQVLVLVKEVRVIRTKNNDLMAFLKVNDVETDLELIVFPQQYQQYMGLIKENEVRMIDGQISLNKRGDKQIIVNHIKAIDLKQLEDRAIEVTKCYVKVSDFQEANSQIQKLKELALENPGPANIILVNDARQTWQFNSPYQISYSQRVQKEVKSLFGHNNVVFK